MQVEKIESIRCASCMCLLRAITGVLADAVEIAKKQGWKYIHDKKYFIVCPGCAPEFENIFPIERVASRLSEGTIIDIEEPDRRVIT